MLTLFLATKNDAKSVFELSNDDIVRQNSICKDKISWQNHIKWFSKKINSKNDIFYIAKENSTFIGYLRLQKENDFWLISIHISPKFRGKGFGSRILQLATIKNASKNLLAMVKKSNIISQEIFKKSGFIYDKIIQINNNVGTPS